MYALCFKNADECSFLSQYRANSILNIISKYFEGIINKKVFDYLNTNNVLNEVGISMDTVDFWYPNSHYRINDVLDNKYISRMNASDISKTFEKAGLLLRIFNYAVTGRDFIHQNLSNG